MTLYKETPREWHDSAITMSDLKEATAEDIAQAEKAHKIGYPYSNKTFDIHNLICFDKEGWMYNDRYCGICKEFVALI